MSGIAGILHFSGPPPLRDEGRQLSVGVAHRGPRDKSWHAEGPGVFVHRRAAGAAEGGPEVDEERVWLQDASVFVGSETALRDAWVTWGKEGLRRVNGDFSFASWNRHEQTLWLGRDAMGTRPLYFARCGDRVAFSSEIPPLLGLPWVSRDLAVNHIAEYLSFRYVHAPRTLLRDVQAVPPGHVVRIDARGTRMESWFQPRWAPPGSQTRIEDAARMVDAGLRSAVERRLDGDRPTAMLLSGGLDSSAMLWHALDLGARPLAVTLALAADPGDESAFAARTATLLGAEHRILRVDGSTLAEQVEEITRRVGQPLPTAAAVLQHVLLDALRPDAQVVLSGDGGDEVLGGRGMNVLAARLRRNRALASLPGPLRLASRSLAARAGLRDLSVSQAHFGRDRAIGGSRVFHSGERARLLRDPGLVRPGIRKLVLEPFYQEVDTDPLNSVLHVWQRGWLPEDSLLRADRTAAHNGLEVRTPLLDPSFVRTCNSLPGTVKVVRQGTGFQTKWPLRLAMQDRLPDAVLRRPKRSLPNPLGRWLRGDGRGFLDDAVDAIQRDAAALFVPQHVARLRDEHVAGRADHGLKLWTLVLFSVWRRQVGA